MEYQNIGMFDRVSLSPNQFRKTGCAFKGWHIELNGNLIKAANREPRLFTDESEVSELATESKTVLTAKAQWEEVKFSGIYGITPRYAPYKCISIAGGSTANYANAQLYSNYNYTYQHFMLCYAGSTNCYYIYDTNSNKLLEAASSAVTYGTNVRLNQYTGGANQIWYLESIDDDYYYICSYLNKEYVFDIRNSSTSNGANLQLFRKRGYYRQQFKFNNINNIIDLSKAYRITPRSSSSACVDVKSADTANGANVQFYEYNYKTQQQYNFSLQSDGGYVIYSCLSDKVLTVEGGKAVNYANIALYEYKNKNSQKWFLQIAGNGYYYFASALDLNYVLDIYGGYTSNGTNIELFKRNGGYNQQFKLEQADLAQIASGTFNMQMFNGRCINLLREVEFNENLYDEYNTFSDGNNYESKFRFDWQDQDKKCNICGLGKYLVYDPSITANKGHCSNIILDENSSEANWYLECAGNGYYYIHNTSRNTKFNYDGKRYGIYDCFKLIRRGNPEYYDTLVAKVNRSISALRGKCKYPVDSIIRDNKNNAKALGPWRLVCQ